MTRHAGYEPPRLAVPVQRGLSRGSPAEGHGFPGAGGQGGQGLGDAGVAGAQGDEPDLPVVELGEDGLGGELESKISSAGSCPVTAFQWSAKAMTSRFWLALDRSALAYSRVWGAESSAKKVSTLLVRWERRGT
jgi:hypothetical protein